MSGRTLASGKLKTQTIQNYGVFPVGEFGFDFSKVTGPQRLKVHFTINDKLSNDWDIWVYPHQQELMQSTGDVLYTTVYDDKAKQYLEQGKKVVLYPMPNRVKGRKSTFHNHFWNPIMFKWPPMTIGCLIHNTQPVFADFITDNHTDWQWWRLTTQSKTLCIDSLYTGVTPLIECVDNFANNRRLTNLFETNCLNGKLVVCSMDLLREQEKNPEKKQLLYSIIEYIKSDKFNPAQHTSPAAIGAFLTSGQTSSGEKPESIY